MDFYSILYPTREQEARSKAHPWLFAAKRGANLKKEYVLRGNKLVLADPDDAKSSACYPALYMDINFHQVIEAICCKADGASLKAYYQDFCCDDDMLAYRQEVFAALSKERCSSLLRCFCQSVGEAQNALQYAEQAACPAQKDRYLIDAVFIYGNALFTLCAAERSIMGSSRGLRAFVAEAAGQAAQMKSLFTEVQEIRREMDGIQIQLRIVNGSVSVYTEKPAQDYAERLNQTLQAQNLWKVQINQSAKDTGVFRQRGMTLLETQVLERVARRYPQSFERMHSAALRVRRLIAEPVARFTQEIRFYFSFDDFRKSIPAIPFTLPEESADGAFELQGVIDLALALTGTDVTPNDFKLAPGELGVVVTGANQGGKTTFARALGQVVVMMMLGLPVTRWIYHKEI
ncbi:MAG: hypothetical protein PHI98_08195 [Eubacteriales bacterium]|nr:hypothetical protein [Eubacteriales bacterium]